MPRCTGSAWSATAAFTHTRARYLELAAAGGADLSGNRVAGRVQVNDANTDAAAGNGVASWRTGWSRRRDDWEVEAFVRVDKLFDKPYVGSVIVNESNQRFFEPAPGRGLGLGARWTLRF